MQEGISFSEEDSFTELCVPSIKDSNIVSDLKAIASDILSKIADVESAVAERAAL